MRQAAAASGPMVRSCWRSVVSGTLTQVKRATRALAQKVLAQ